MAGYLTLETRMAGLLFVVTAISQGIKPCDACRKMVVVVQIDGGEICFKLRVGMR